MALSGNLHDIALPDIVQLLAAQGLSGRLSLTRGRERVRLTISEGKAVDSDSNRRPLHQRLGGMLVRGGRLAETDLERALQMQAQGQRRLGEILVSEGMVERDDLRRALHIQFLQIIYEVLRWADGSYDFERCAVDYDRANIEPVGFQQILMDGMRRIDEWPIISKRVANRQTILQRSQMPGATAEPSDPFAAAPPAAPAGPSLEGLEAEIYGLVDGRSSIQQIIDRSMQFEFDACRALYDLQEKGLIGPAYEGRLDEVGFPDLLLALRRRRSSGRLELDRGTSSAILRFRDGEVTSVEASDPDDAIGPRLFARGWIRRHDLERDPPAPGADAALGAELVRNGIIERAQLERESDELQADIVLSLFSWTAGQFRFRPGIADGPVAGDLERRTPAIILKGIRSIDRWSRIQQAVGPARTTYFRSQAVTSPAMTSLAAEYQSFLDLFAADRTLAEAAEHADVPEFFTYQLVWALLVLGLLERQQLSPRTELLLAALNGEPPVEADEVPADDADFDVTPEAPEAAVAVAAVAPPRPRAVANTAANAELDLDAVAARVTAGMFSGLEYVATASPVPELSETDLAGDFAPDDLGPDDDERAAPVGAGVHAPWARTPSR